MSLLASACTGGQGQSVAGDDPEATAEPLPGVPIGAGPRCPIELAEVALYQGVKVTLARGDAAVPSPSAPVIEGRPALVRVFVTPGAAAPAEETTVRLSLASAAGVRTYEGRRMVAAASSDDSLDSTFDFDVAAAELTPEAALSVEIVGCEGLPQARFPAAGQAALHPAHTGTLRVVLVPVRYDTDGSGRLPDTSEAQLARYRAQLLAMYPVAAVELTLHEPVGTSLAVTAGTGWSELLESVRALRAKEHPTEDIYYYGAIAPAASNGAYCGSGCITGISYRASARNPQSRASVGIGFTGQGAVEAMAHEIGHAHGRAHAPCGGPKDVDGAYPYPNAEIGVWGYDGRQPRRLIPPASKDIMGYCGPRWLSDYTFRGLADRSALVNARDDAPVARVAGALTASAAGRRWRVLLVDAAGTPRWGLNAEGPPPGDAVLAELLDEAGGSLGSIEVHAVELADSDERVYWVPDTGTSAAAIRVPGATPAALAAASAVPEMRR
jgi:hypothetical protein